MRESLKENLNTITFVAGLSMLTAGMSAWFGWPVAMVFAGAILMTLSAWPYFEMFKRMEP